MPVSQIICRKLIRFPLIADYLNGFKSVGFLFLNQARYELLVAAIISGTDSIRFTVESPCLRDITLAREIIRTAVASAGRVSLRACEFGCA